MFRLLGFERSNCRVGSRSAWSLDSCRKISWNFVFGVSKTRLHKENHSGKLRVHWGGDRTKFVSQPCSDVWISYLVWKPHLHFSTHYGRIWAIESIWIFERAYLPTLKACQKTVDPLPDHIFDSKIPNEDFWKSSKFIENPHLKCLIAFLRAFRSPN